MGFRALLVGINAYAEKPLSGCLNDVALLKGVLEERYGLSSEQLRVLEDRAATTAAISDGLAWLAEPIGDRTRERRLFFYAGHGTQRADTTGMEPDGAMECLVPFDHQTAGRLSDDRLRELYAAFAPDMHLVVVMDCCHSGTLDRQVERIDRFMEPDEDEQARIEQARESWAGRREQLLVDQLRPLAGRAVEDAELFRVARRIALLALQPDDPHQPPDNLVLIAACTDAQTAVDAPFGDRHFGALTFFLANALREHPEQPSYGQLMAVVRSGLFAGQFEQLPRLSCSPGMEVRPFLLRPD